MEETALNQRRWSLSRLLPPLLLLASIAALKWLDIFNSRYLASGAPLIGSHLARLVFMTSIAWLAWRIGYALLLRARAKSESQLPGGVEGFLLCSFTGVAVLNIAGYLLGLLHALYFWPLALLVILLLYWLPAKEALTINLQALQSELSTTLRREPLLVLLLFPLLALTTWFITARGLLPPLEMDQVALYLPYYEEVVRSHTNWPNQWFLTNFYAGGDGLRFLTVLLTDSQSLQLTAVYLMLMTFALLYTAIIKIVPEKKSWGVAAVLLLFTTEMVQSIYQKTHPCFWALIIFVAYAAGRTVTLSKGAGEPWRRALLISLIALALLSSQVALISIGALGVVFLSITLLALRRRTIESDEERNRIAFLLKVCLLGGGVVVITLLFNYFTTGLFEISPHHLFLKYKNEKILESYASSSLDVYFDFIMTLVPSEGSFRSVLLLSPLQDIGNYLSAGSLGSPWNTLLGGAAALLIALALYREMKRATWRASWGLSLSLGILLGLAYLLTRLITQTSIVRLNLYSEWLGLYFIFLGAIELERQLTAIAARLPRPGFTFHLPGFVNSTLIAHLLLTAVTITLLGNWYNRKSSEMLSELSFATGKQSYAMIYRPVIHPPCYIISNLLPPGSRVLPLSFEMGCAGSIRRVEMQNPTMNVFFDRYREVLLGEADRAEEILRERGVIYFYIDPMREYHSLARSQFFSPEEIEKRMTIIWRQGTGFLLTFRKPGQAPPSDEFIAMHREGIKPQQFRYWQRAWYSAYEKARKNSTPTEQ